MTHLDREPVLLPFVGYEDACILLGFHNPKVGGSIPPPATNIFNNLRRDECLPFFACHAPVM
jgi:hypothetical protein